MLWPTLPVHQFLLQKGSQQPLTHISQSHVVALDNPSAPCPEAANVQQQLHHPVPPPGIRRLTGAAALALLALPGHLPGCPPGKRTHHHRHRL
ncbi:hypothetical protein llap_20425 [Limosa lapponica baueri]|uniref:Uncharacterized protein n=1 Tax=Limosa lapponica baueri TaxID=1758121 RepID=A0A2I0T665_LIMLA|nr:hypothetical protein llap_20425 [Limosa lapponica baueri]